MSIQAIVTLAQEHFDRAGTRKQKKAMQTFKNTYPSLTEQMPGDGFYLWYYIHYIISDYKSIYVTLPQEAIGPFHTLLANYTGYSGNEPWEDSRDSWSIDAFMTDGSPSRVAQCRTKPLSAALKKRLYFHLKAIKSVPEYAFHMLSFTSIDLMMAMALSLYDLINKTIQGTLTVKEWGRIYRAYIAEDKRIASEEDIENCGHRFTWSIYGLQWLQEEFFPEHKIMGYSTEDNPEAEVGEDEEGHEFLLVAKRYMINVWSRKVYGSRKVPIVVDLHEQPELARKLYGDPKTWEAIG